jgi:transposase
VVSTEKKVNQYTAEFKARAVKLAVESTQSFSRTAEELGINKNTLHTWIGNYPRGEGVEKKVSEVHLYDELKRLKKENARLKEERDILKAAAAYFAKESP